MSKAKRVCVIGAGPSGMSILYQFNELKAQGKEIPDIICYDKQSDWGGLWKYSWETGTDSYGEPTHGSMYRGLWSNAPKESLEFPDYTFEEHFGKPIPSYPPRTVLYDYLTGRWKKHDLRPWIHFNHVVRHVTYNDDTDDFTVLVKNLPEDRVLPAERFDYVIVATGHFSVPNMPYFTGIDKFPGRIIHSHEFRNAYQYKDKTILVVGSSYSAEDIALQTIKYGAKKVVCTWRTKPMGFKWPPQITEKPLLTKIEGNTVHFKDGTTEVVDDVILCTGYLFSFPFMEERLRLKTCNALYVQGLYKSILWMHGGNNKIHYLGMVNQYYTFTMFDAQAHWVMKCIMGEIALPDKQTMEQDAKKWIAKMGECNGTNDGIDFQTAYIADVVKDSKYSYDLDAAEFFYGWEKNKMNDITTYRDQCHKSKFTGNASPELRIPFMKAMDDSLEAFVRS